MAKIISTFIPILLLLSCGQHAEKKASETVTTGNESTTISTDTAKLATLINLKEFKPTHAKFKYVLINNSGKNERLTVPGPSNYSLEAVLYFDTTTFKRLRTKYYNVDFLSPNLDKQDFNFDWLDKDLKEQLLKSDTNYHGHPDFFLGQLAKLWLLDNKLLYNKQTN